MKSSDDVEDDVWDFRGVPKKADDSLTERAWKTHYSSRKTYAGWRKSQTESRALRYERREKRQRGERDLEEQSQGLLPGLPDDITVELISTKLSWSDLRKLSTVSRSWRQAIQSRQVYDARVRSKRTESLEVLHDSLQNALLVCSKTDKTAPVHVVLSPISHNTLLLNGFYGMVSFDGKIYVLGGVQSPVQPFEGTEPKSKVNANVFVLDLAGQKKWAECASMPAPLIFGLKQSRCHVKDGKIYVCRECCFGKCRKCGGTVCDVYDPNTNSWSSQVLIKLRHWHASSLQV